MAEQIVGEEHTRAAAAPARAKKMGGTLSNLGEKHAQATSCHTPTCCHRHKFLSEN
jgi:hypothetical protein